MQENLTEKSANYLFQQPPRVSELLARNTDWNNVYLKLPSLNEVRYTIPQPSIQISEDSEKEKYFLYPENQYLIRITEFLEACIAKLDQLISGTTDSTKLLDLQKKRDYAQKFKDNLSFITMSEFNRIIDIYSSRIFEMLKTKTVFFYEQKARSERYVIINLIKNLIIKIEQSGLAREEQEGLLKRIRYNPSFEESGTPTSYYDRAGDKLTDDAVVVYADDFIQSGNYVISQQSGARNVKDTLLNREGYTSVDIQGFYIAAYDSSIKESLKPGLNIAYRIDGYWDYGLSGSWSSLDYLYENQLKELSTELDIPLPFGYSIKGRYDRRVTSLDGVYNYGEYLDSQFNRDYESISKRFKIDYKS